MTFAHVVPHHEGLSCLLMSAADMKSHQFTAGSLVQLELNGKTKTILPVIRGKDSQPAGTLAIPTWLMSFYSHGDARVTGASTITRDDKKVAATKVELGCIVRDFDHRPAWFPHDPLLVAIERQLLHATVRRFGFHSPFPPCFFELSLSLSFPRFPFSFFSGFAWKHRFGEARRETGPVSLDRHQ